MHCKASTTLYGTRKHIVIFFFFFFKNFVLLSPGYNPCQHQIAVRRPIFFVFLLYYKTFALNVGVFGTFATLCLGKIFGFIRAKLTIFLQPEAKIAITLKRLKVET